MLKANCLHCVTAAELHNIFLEMLKTFATVLIYTLQKFAFVSKHKRRSTVEASKKKKKKNSSNSTSFCSGVHCRGLVDWIEVHLEAY